MSFWTRKVLFLVKMRRFQINRKIKLNKTVFIPPGGTQPEPEPRSGPVRVGHSPHRSWWFRRTEAPRRTEGEEPPGRSTERRQNRNRCGRTPPSWVPGGVRNRRAKPGKAGRGSPEGRPWAEPTELFHRQEVTPGRASQVWAGPVRAAEAGSALRLLRSLRTHWGAGEEEKLCSSSSSDTDLLQV